MKVTVGYGLFFFFLFTLNVGIDVFSIKRTWAEAFYLMLTAEVGTGKVFIYLALLLGLFSSIRADRRLRKEGSE